MPVFIYNPKCINSFFKLGFTPCKVGQPLRGVVIKKEPHKD